MQQKELEIDDNAQVDNHITELLRSHVVLVTLLLLVNLLLLFSLSFSFSIFFQFLCMSKSMDETYRVQREIDGLTYFMVS